MLTPEEVKDMIFESPRGYHRTIMSSHKDLVNHVSGLYGCDTFAENIYNYINRRETRYRCKCGNNVRFYNVKLGYSGMCRPCYDIKQVEDTIKHANRLSGAPKCDSEGCDELTKFDEVHGKWNKYCSFKCRGFENSKRSRGKSKATMLERHGVEHAMQCPSNIDKGRKTSLEKYGSPNVTYAKLGIPEEVIDKLSDKDYLGEKYELVGTKGIAGELGISVSCAEKALRRQGFELKGGKSLFEKSVFNFIKSIYSGEILTNDRKVLGGKELDIYMPELDIAIECNGTFWHSELQGRDKKYHLDKLTECESRGVRLVHLWEHDWNNKQEIFKSMISCLLGKIERFIPARKCTIENIPSSESKEFLDSNHRQGNCVASIRYGLFYEGELVQVLTVGKSRFSKKYEYELLRLCTSVDTVVMGGSSKLFSRFIKDFVPNSVGSYSDISMNTGGIYRELGFDFSHNSQPNYRYTKNYIDDFESRVAYQKHKLAEKLDTYDANKTEWENMKMNGFDRIWDCGNSLWIWRTPE